MRRPQGSAKDLLRLCNDSENAALHKKLILAGFVNVERPI
jgi:hypothetical protein